MFGLRGIYYSSCLAGVGELKCAQRMKFAVKELILVEYSEALSEV